MCPPEKPAETREAGEGQRSWGRDGWWGGLTSAMSGGELWGAILREGTGTPDNVCHKHVKHLAPSPARGKH